MNPSEEANIEQLLRDTLNLWVNPEIKRRQDEGNLPKDFRISAAQVIFNSSKEEPVIRLNDEVKAVLKIPRKEIHKEPILGEPINPEDISTIENIILTDSDLNAAHITIVFHQNHFFIKKDLRFNAGFANQSIAAAREFLDCSIFSLSKSYRHSFIDNAYSAAELMATCLLFLIDDRSPSRDATHSYIASKINSMNAGGGLDSRYVSLLNNLKKYRKSARYFRGNRAENLDMGEAQRMLGVAEEFFQFVKTNIPERFSLPPGRIT